MKKYVSRLLEAEIKATLKRGKSVLLLGARQTGKTTLVEHALKPDISYTFARANTRQRYESNPALFESELEERIKSYKKTPLIFIDEIQKIPRIMDIVQNLIDTQSAQFILSGSSARKLKHGKELNLLPGRVVAHLLSPLLYSEIPDSTIKLEDLLLYGSLPGIILESDEKNREIDLYSYVSTYLEEEIRMEALVRNVGSFTRFLEIAAGESGNEHNFTRISQAIGVAGSTIASYYQILEDCLITHRIDPLTESQSKRRLIKSPKYLLFDLGVRRACANEGLKLPEKYLGHLFEHFVGNQLVDLSHLNTPHINIRYWRDFSGPEIDFVLDSGKHYIPVEVKWSDKPNKNDAKHLIKFMNEYSVKKGFVVCRTPHTYKIDEKIWALPWQELEKIFDET